MKEKSKINTKVLIAEISVLDEIAEKMDTRELLERYTKFLLKHNYVDADVYAEEPTAIERFLASL